MPIRPYLAGKAFDPETISEMSGALDSLCTALSLKIIDAAARRLVAQKIIELAQRRGARSRQSVLPRTPRTAKRNEARRMNEKVSFEEAGKRISGRYVVRDGMVIVTASDGRTTTGVIEDSMLSAETLAKTLLFQLHRQSAPTDDQ